MEIELLTIGKSNIKFVKEGLEEYCNRLKKYIPYRIESVPDIKNSGKISEQEQKEQEGKGLLGKISATDYVILLDERGDSYTSREFSRKLEKWMGMGRKRIIFIIGGPYGFSDAVYERSDGMLSLSKMTFNHEMARLFFTEQVYRAMSILRGEPYHHD